MSSSRLRALVAIVIAIAGAVSLAAHRRDEYLQAARVAIDPARVAVELDLTPGIALADAVVGSIDRNGNGSISSDEAKAYATDVSRAITLELDGRPLAVELVDAVFPSVESMRRGEGIIRLRLAAATGSTPAGAHQLVYRNAHRADIGVYLANALLPADDRVAVTSQRRDPDQRHLEIDYMVRSGGIALSGTWIVVGAALLLPVLAVLGWRTRRRD